VHHAAIVLSDAHLGQAPTAVTDALHQFLAAIPALAGHVVINGDLFDFWFEYRTVIPRAAFRTLAVLAQVAAGGTRVTVTGGNHDRWGSDFWEREVGATFHPHGVELELAGLRALVSHGDGLDGHVGSRLLGAITRFPLTPRVFRWVHPDIGIRLARRMSGSLAETTRRGAVLRGSAAALERHARALLERRPELDLVIFGHSHRPALEAVGSRRWYANPGAWMEGFRYLEISEAGPALRAFTPSTP
jgi:UDP-2,3-diacylglucosamine hydrolase